MGWALYIASPYLKIKIKSYKEYVCLSNQSTNPTKPNQTKPHNKEKAGTKDSQAKPSTRASQASKQARYSSVLGGLNSMGVCFLLFLLIDRSIDRVIDRSDSSTFLLRLLLRHDVVSRVSHHLARKPTSKCGQWVVTGE